MNGYIQATDFMPTDRGPSKCHPRNALSLSSFYYCPSVYSYVSHVHSPWSFKK